MEKQIFTSNYARNGGNPKSIAISRKPPDWYEGYFMLELAPTWDIILDVKNKNISQQEFTKRYIDLLYEKDIDPEKLINDLPDGTILLCYESPSDFCHRHILSEWIYLHTNFKITEWMNEKEQKQLEYEKRIDQILQF